MKSHVLSLHFHRPTGNSRSLNRNKIAREIYESTNTDIASRRPFVNITGFAAPYDDLAAKGYRWVTINGPYACPSKDDLRQIIQHHTDETELQMIERPRAYYLIEGAIVQVVLEDAASGMSQIHSAEIGPDIWTLTRFLSRHPIRNTDGEIEVPLRSLTPHR